MISSAVRATLHTRSSSKRPLKQLKLRGRQPTVKSPASVASGLSVGAGVVMRATPLT